MTRRTAEGGRSEAALFIALMLVVQALLSGLSLGLSAASSDSVWQIDASGRIICSRDGGTTQDQPAAPHHTPTDCCTLGCSMVGALTPELPREAATHPAPARSLDIGLARAEDPRSSPGRTPQNPRAPPLAA